MTATAIKIPDLPTGLTLSVKLLNMTSLAVLDTVTLTESGESYNGNVAAAIAGQFLFKILSGTALVGSRIRTIADDAGPYVILTELEQLASDGRCLLYTSPSPRD